MIINAWPEGNAVGLSVEHQATREEAGSPGGRSWRCGVR